LWAGLGVALARRRGAISRRDAIATVVLAMIHRAGHSTASIAASDRLPGHCSASGFGLR